MIGWRILAGRWGWARGGWGGTGYLLRLGLPMRVGRGSPVLDWGCYWACAYALRHGRHGLRPLLRCHWLLAQNLKCVWCPIARQVDLPHLQRNFEAA